MSDKETENQSWADPKDFGLPYVEPIPLRPVQIPKQEVTPSLPVSTSISFDEKPPAQPEVEEERIKIWEEEPKEAKRRRTKKRKKKFSKYWVLPVLISGLIILGMISWLLILKNPDLLKFESNQEVENTPEPIEETPEPADQIIASEQNQPVDNQDTALVAKDSILVSSKPEETVTDLASSKLEETGTTLASSKPKETGTTIVNNTSENNLIRIDSRAEKVRYFVVAASLPNEKLALEIIDKFSGKSPEFYLIYPFDSSPNYRVAVRKFNTWKEASKEAAKIRSEFSEDMWILTY